MALIDNSDPTYAYFLCAMQSIGNVEKRRLIAHFKNPKAVYEASEKDLFESFTFRTKKRLSHFLKERSAFDLNEVNKLHTLGIRLITQDEPQYPSILKEIIDYPYGLFYKGVLPSDYQSAIAIVGARNCSGYGLLAAEEMAAYLADAGALIVSGMAKGIDGAAHRGALKANKQTIAVLGCGVDICYPRIHQAMYEDILSSGGCIVSELVPGTQPLPIFFPARNRMISGLSRITTVIEAKLKSGSLITADLALEQGRDVFALPGRISDPLSEGTNALIEQGAGIIRNKEQFKNTLCELGMPLNTMQKPLVKEKRKKISLEKDEKLVYSCLDFTASSMDELMEKCDLPFPVLIEALDTLKRNGLICECGKNHYKLLPS